MRTRPLPVATLLAGLLLIAASAVGAQTRRAPEQPQLEEPPQVTAVLQCRSIADNAQRLACFDAAVAGLAEASARRDIVVVDRAQVRETRRRLFGFALPHIRLFGGGDDNDDNDAEEVREIDGVVASVNGGNGGWAVTLEDGGTWIQTDHIPLAIWPRHGTRVHIRRGALGNYMMNVAGQPAIRVRRAG